MFLFAAFPFVLNIFHLFDQMNERFPFSDKHKAQDRHNKISNNGQIIKEHDKSSRRKDTQHNKTDRFYIKNTLF